MFEYFKEYFDFKTFFITLALVGTGLISVYSATYDAGAGSIFQRQLTWAGIGFVAMVVTAILPLKTIYRLVGPGYLLLLLVLLVLLVIGKTVSGSRSWFSLAKDLGGQPSEFAKVASLLALAAFLSRSTTVISDPKHLIVAI